MGMEDAPSLLEDRIPDLTSTVDLPVRLAAEIDFLAGRVDRWSDPGAQCTPAVSARSRALLTRPVDARQALARVDVATAPIADIAAAAWAASRAGGPTVATILERLDAEASEFLDDGLPIGPRRMYMGLLHAASGDLGLAIDELGKAVVVGDHRAPLWGALCRLELGRVLRTAEAVPFDASSAAPVLTAARTFFVAGGYRSLLGRVEHANAPVRATLEVERQSPVSFGVQPEVVIRSSKGLVALRHLVTNGHRVVTAAELAQVVDGGDGSRIAAMASAAWMSGDTEIDPLDAGASEMIRSMFFDDTTRSRVTKLLRRTITSLSESHRLMAAHLGASVVTGHGCRYRPAGAAIQWNEEPSR